MKSRLAAPPGRKLVHRNVSTSFFSTRRQTDLLSHGAAAALHDLVSPARVNTPDHSIVVKRQEMQVCRQPATQDRQLRSSQRIHTSTSFRTKRNTRTALQDTSMSLADHHSSNVSRVPAHAREVLASAFSIGRRQSHGDEEST